MGKAVQEQGSGSEADGTRTRNHRIDRTRMMKIRRRPHSSNRPLSSLRGFPAASLVRVRSGSGPVQGAVWGARAHCGLKLRDAYCTAAAG